MTVNGPVMTTTLTNAFRPVIYRPIKNFKLNLNEKMFDVSHCLGICCFKHLDACLMYVARARALFQIIWIQVLFCSFVKTPLLEMV